MFRIIEILGVVAPLAALVLLVAYRRAIPSTSLALGVIGCVLAALNVLVGFVGKRVVWFGSLDGGGLEGALGWLGTVAALRLGLLVLAVALLVIAAFHGRSASDRVLPWVLGAAVPLLVGLITPLLVGEVEHELLARDHGGLAVMATLLGEAVQFAALGLGILALSVGVTTGRGAGSSQQRDSAVLVRDTVRSAWTMYRRHTRNRSRSGVGGGSRRILP
ncbi:hypothetical protein [Brachybacterium fresconis]|uniref:Uncharacterized protein n=1 Tax=Brachybacterium fresconis TaxID=173363 RepID=A0ABS4YPD3_9MICO|nr:hypothetical protein [Brachybacterium fresconis]MBP2410330.1 hypothetical protein [Brachybacterium fresconis]